MSERLGLAMLHARTLSFKRKLEAARAVVSEALEKSPTWYVALSGGKDSTVVLNLVREQLSDAAAVISIHKWRLPETTDYLARLGNLQMVASGSRHGTTWARNWANAAEAAEYFPGIRWFEKDADRESFGRSEGGVFLGLRKEENSYRRKHLGRFGSLFFARVTGKWHCSPIGNWSVLDVWAFIHSQALDYNRAYDVMERLGVPLREQRIGPLAVDAVLGFGQLTLLKRGWPDFFNRYAQEHPEARNYV